MEPIAKAAYRRRLVPKQRVYLSLVSDQTNEDYFVDVFLRTWKKIPSTVRTKILDYIAPMGLWVLVETLGSNVGECRMVGHEIAIDSSLVNRAPERSLEHTIAHELAHSFQYAVRAEALKKKFSTKDDRKWEWMLVKQMKAWATDEKENHVEGLLESWGFPPYPPGGFELTESDWKRVGPRFAEVFDKQKGKSKVMRRSLSRLIEPKKKRKKQLK